MKKVNPMEETRGSKLKKMRKIIMDAVIEETYHIDNDYYFLV
jgi:hypothetical protein